MISLISVTKKFRSQAGETIAVNKVNLKIKSGEIIGFVGPNGAGKTTTMRLILGYLRTDSGSIDIDGLSPLEDRIDVLKKIGYLPENNPLYQEITVNEYLDFISKIKGGNIQEIIKKVELNEVINKKIEELSRGYKQRVGLAAALLSDPPILILDEPTSGLDPLEQEKIKKLIKKIAKKKVIIFSTHILSEVEDVASRLIIINRGNIVYDDKKPRGKGKVEKLFRQLVK